MILPNFLICGAQKAGTTALYKYLNQHPDVFMSRPKETWFFDVYYDHGIDWFARHFEGHDGEQAIGEATARTMAAPEAPARIAKHLADARLVFILRDPVDRAYSQYYFYISTGKADPDRAFHDVIRDQQSTFRKDMVSQGMYDDQLQRFEMYFSCSQMKIILHEDLRDRPTETVRDVYRFLNVNPTHAPMVEERHNVTRYPGSRKFYHWVRTAWQPFRQVMDAWFPKAANAMRREVRQVLFSKEKPAMQEEDRAYLRRIYAKPNARLEKRIGRDLSHWT